MVFSLLMGLDTFGAVLPHPQDKIAPWVPGRKGPPVLYSLYSYSVVLKYLANRSSRSSVSTSSSLLLRIRFS